MYPYNRWAGLQFIARRWLPEWWEQVGSRIQNPQLLERLLRDQMYAITPQLNSADYRQWRQHYGWLTQTTNAMPQGFSPQGLTPPPAPPTEELAFPWAEGSPYRPSFPAPWMQPMAWPGLTDQEMQRVLAYYSQLLPYAELAEAARRWQQQLEMQQGEQAFNREQFAEDIRRWNEQFNLSLQQFGLTRDQFEEDIRRWNEQMGFQREQFGLTQNQFLEDIRRWNEQMGFQREQFDFSRDRFTEDIRRWNEQMGFQREQFGLTQDQFAEDIRRWNEQMGFQREQFGEDIRRWEREFGLAERQSELPWRELEESTRRWEQEMDWRKKTDAYAYAGRAKLPTGKYLRRY